MGAQTCHKKYTGSISSAFPHESGFSIQFGLSGRSSAELQAHHLFLTVNALP